MPFADRPDARIWWDQDGSGDPVLLIMGHAYGAGMWHRTAPELAASYRVIRFDNRGAGRSSDPAGPYSVPLLADDALAVLDAAGAVSAHVYGVSLGGAIALQLALDHPGRVRSLILGCTAASAGSLPRGALPARARSLLPAAALNRMAWQLLYVLAEIRIPALVLHGAQDRIVPAASARRRHRRSPARDVPGRRARLLPGPAGGSGTGPRPGNQRGGDVTLGPTPATGTPWCRESNVI